MPLLRSLFSLIYWVTNGIEPLGPFYHVDLCTKIFTITFVDWFTVHLSYYSLLLRSKLFVAPEVRSIELRRSDMFESR